MAANPNLKLAVPAIVAVGIAAVLWFRGGGTDVRTPAVQDEGRYGLATVHEVETRVTASSANEVGSSREYSRTAMFSFQAEGRRFEAGAPAGSDASGVEGNRFLVMYSSIEPELNILDLSMPAAQLAVAVGEITGIETGTVPQRGLFSSAREKKMYRYAYSVDGEEHTRLEWLGVPDTALVGEQRPVVYLRDDVDEARLLVDRSMPGAEPPSLESLFGP